MTTQEYQEIITEPNVTEDELWGRALEEEVKQLDRDEAAHLEQEVADAFGIGCGDYSTERHKWVDQLTLEEILEQIEQLRKAS